MRRAGLWVAVLVAVTACARPKVAPVAPVVPAFTEANFVKKPLETYTIPTPAPGKMPEVSVIGAMRTYTIRDGDTLMDVARWFDLGFNEMVDANPDVDEWVPPVGKTVLVPTTWVLPCCTYDGMVVNIPEMRLYFFQKKPGDPKTTIVRTYPVGLGRDDRRTPRKTFRVVGKTKNPTWNIPPRIRQDHIRESGDHRSAIRGGDPDNPLGKYRFDLSISPYAIHGTNIPWGVGMNVSNGCARLYPEDVEHLFPLVPVGTPGAFVYQPVKVGRRDDRTWVEAHRDVYRYGSAIPSGSRAAMKRFGVAVNDPGVKAAVKAGLGVPMALTPAPQEHASR
ncbi:MAG TPA: L,D-transpeptidase family protein [Candidatus Binatia bacterium]|jgi:L,D-transpeptidase ErfK/SrfK|nr:L,D-transpeptidase family protein [Candidatus Binatia bacterium]